MQPTITHTKATPMQRFLAYFIDSLVAYVPIFLLGLVSYKLAMIGYVLALVYFLLRDALPIGNGQGLGKKLMGIKVIKEDTRQPILGDYVAALVRQISLMIPFVNLYDMWLVVSDGKRLGDGWAKTEVVQA